MTIHHTIGFMLKILIFVVAAASFVGLSTSTNLQWGTYRPNVYFGARAKHPQSPLIGFMWYDAGKYESISQMRHECSDNDQLSTYGWHRHNGDDFGQQIFYDPLTNLQLTTSFIKFEYTTKHGLKDEGWIGFFEGSNIPRGPNIASGVLGTIWYITSGENTTIDNEPKIKLKNSEKVFGKNNKYYESEFIQLVGNIPDISYNYTIVSILDRDNLYGVAIRPTKKNKLKTQQMNKRTYISGVRMSDANKWRAKEIAQTLLNKQGKKLYKRTRKIIENDFPDQERQQQIISQLSPNLKHGIFDTNPNGGSGGNDLDNANVYLFQNYLLNPFRMHLVFLPHSADLDIKDWNDLPEQINDREKIRKIIEKRVFLFDKKFENQFNIVYKKPLLYENNTVKTNKSEMTEDEIKYFDRKYDNKTNKKYVSVGEYRLARYGISNMLGGIGYWYGNQIWKMPENSDVTYTDPMTLVSAVPSRSFFPRGFLWDEGFHQQLIGLWNVDISLEILNSWLNNMNQDGWIAREQILGDEARSRVPAKFQIQKPHIANPPTLFLAIYGLYNRYVLNGVTNLEGDAATADENEFEDSECLSQAEVNVDGTTSNNDEDAVNDDLYKECVSNKKEKSKENTAKVEKFLSDNYNGLVLHFNWYSKTQLSPLSDNYKGNNNKDIFRWRGRTPNHNLPSGLDDYPRFVNITDYEGHVDIQCWMIKLYDIMSKLSKFVGNSDSSIQYEKQRDLLYDRLITDFWDPSVNGFQDFAYTKEENYEIKHFVNHIGYVSSFPLLLNVLPINSDKLPYLLNQLSNNETGIWSDYGLRSLSKGDSLYGKGEDYWRSSIWVNINYLALKALKHYQNEYIKVSGEGTFVNDKLKDKIDTLYDSLKSALVNNVYREFAKFGYMYENYNSDTGYGQKSKPFTGWTACVANIIAELYP